MPTTSAGPAAVDGQGGPLPEQELGRLLAHLAVEGDALRARAALHAHLLRGEVAVTAGVLAHAQQGRDDGARPAEAEVGAQVLDVEHAVLEPGPPGGGE